MMLVDKVWRSLLSDVYYDGNTISPRGLETRERLAYTSRVPMTEPLVTLPARKLGYRFAAAEAAWILSGDNRVSPIAKFSKEIARFSDDGLTFFGAYGPPFVEQAAYVVRTLLDDLSSRQALMTIWRQRPGPTRDVPCTVALQWLVRGGKLNCVATMRSSDAWLGWPYDVHNFSMLSASILLRLRYAHRAGHATKAAWTRNLQLGDLFLTAGSQHLYSTNYDGALAVLDRHGDEAGLDYRPLEVGEFDHPDDLPEHLWNVALRKVTCLERSWLLETIPKKD